MKKQDLLNTIKKERKEGNDFIKLDRGRYYAMRFDVSDGEFWVDCFADGNNFKKYKSDSIITIRLEDIIKGYDYSEETICNNIFNYCLATVGKGVLEDYL